MHQVFFRSHKDFGVKCLSLFEVASFDRFFDFYLISFLFNLNLLLYDGGRSYFLFLHLFYRFWNYFIRRFYCWLYRLERRKRDKRERLLRYLPRRLFNSIWRCLSIMLLRDKPYLSVFWFWIWSWIICFHFLFSWLCSLSIIFSIKKWIKVLILRSSSRRSLRWRRGRFYANRIVLSDVPLLDVLFFFFNLNRVWLFLCYFGKDIWENLRSVIITVRRIVFDDFFFIIKPFIHSVKIPIQEHTWARFMEKILF